mgnify:CR=1 FL=1
MPEQQSQSILREDNIPLRFLQQNKDQQEIKDEKQEEHQQLIDEKLKVYTMPKQFIGAKDKSENKDETGHNLNNRKFLFLIVPLVVVLLAGLAAAYFLVIKSSAPKSQPIPTYSGEPLTQKEETAPAVLEQEPSVVIPPESNEDTGVELEEDIDIPVEEPEPISPETDQNLIQKIAVSYDNQGKKTTEAVLSLEPEQNIDYRLITIAEYISEEKLELFSAIAGQPYKIELRGQKPGSASVLSITYSENLLENLDLIPADLRIGYLSLEALTKDWYKSEEAPEIWQILKAQDLDDEVRSISSILEGVFEGIYAIVPIKVNEMIDLPMPPEEIPEESPEPQEIIMAQDSDNDLLTDKEELLYGTSPQVPDSDADNYNDGDEVLGLYSPARGAGVSLEEDTQFIRWQNADYNYSVLAPRAFTASNIDEESTADVIFKSSDNESILISLQDNSQALPLKEWLLSISPEIDVENIAEFETKSNFMALVSANKTVYYIEPSDQSPYIFVFFYNSPAEYSYISTLRMMVESLQYEKSS